MADTDPTPKTPARRAASTTRQPAAKRPDAKDKRIAALEARVAELEDELQRQAQASNALVARSQEKLYWLERWQVDLDNAMKRPGMLPALEAVRSLRGVVRGVRKLARGRRGA